MPTSATPLESLSARANAAEIGQFLEAALSAATGLQALSSAGDAARVSNGYGHTIREMAQQPFVWADTANRAIAFARDRFAPMLAAGKFRSITLVGSGSSHYVGELVAPALAQRMALPVTAVPAGNLLTHGRAALPLPGPTLLVSIARSGNSPESVGAVRVAAREAPDTQLLHITCNLEGRLAQPAPDDPPADRLVLNPLSNDQSLVMTSSFTSLSLAALALGYAGSPAAYLAQAERLCADLASRFAALLSEAAALPYSTSRRAVFLGSGCQYGAAREAALKLTEMTAGGVVAMAETHLGLRHGPMAAVQPDTLIVSFTPPGLRAARYASDLLAELATKALGSATVVLPPGTEASGAEEAAIDEPFAAIANVVSGQVIGFFACLHHGLRPDAPSAQGVIARVVPPFPIYD